MAVQWHLRQCHTAATLIRIQLRHMYETLKKYNFFNGDVIGIHCGGSTVDRTNYLAVYQNNN